MVSIDSQEYPADFLVLQSKTKFNGYPLILARPWIATADAYVSCRSRNMSIKNGHFSKQLVLYPSTQLSLDHDIPLWLEEEEEDEVYRTTSHPICTLDVVIGWGQPDKDDLIDQILLNQPPNTMPLNVIVNESEGNPLTELCLVDPSLAYDKMVNLVHLKPCKINPPSLSQPRRLVMQHAKRTLRCLWLEL